MDEITTLISTLGFPIAMCVYFVYDKVKTQSILLQALQENTKAFTELKEVITLTMKGDNE